MNDDGSDLSVADYVEYCQTQARLLLGSVETMREEADELIAEIDEELATIDSNLDERADSEGPSAAPSLPGDSDGVEAGLEEAEQLAGVEQKQQLVKAKQTRIELFQQLAAEYTELGDKLQTAVDDPEEALERVIEFEAEHDAPLYFQDSQTALEAATGSPDTDAE